MTDGPGLELKTWRGVDVLRTTALVTGFLLALILLWLAREIFLTAFIGVLFGLAVSSGARQLARVGIPRGLGAALVVFGFLALLAGIVALVAPALSEQAAELRRRLPEAVDRLQTWVNARPGLANMIPGDTATTAAGATPLRARAGEALAGATHYLFPFLSSTIAVAAGLFFIIVLSIYTGGDPELYHRGLMHLFPHRSRERVGVVLSRVALVLRKWLVTQLVAMVVIGVAVTIVLLILGVKAAFALGVIAGLLEFIPTIGPILSAIPGIAMGIIDSPQKALEIGLAYLLIQQLEGHLLIPMLMKEGIDLPPALTIVTQGVMALLFGFLGLLVAVPMVAAVMVFVKLLYVERVIGDEAYPVLRSVAPE